MPSLSDRILPILGDIKHWGRNAKITVFTETFWSMPISWILFYQTIFMRELGIGEAFIGYCVSVSLILQAFLPVLGGYLADRFGRKRTIMFFDAAGWIGTTVTFFLAKEFWEIMLAMVFQGLPYAIEGVWDAYLGEDTNLEHRTGVFGFIRLIWIVAGLMTPVAGALVSLYGIEQGFRYISLVGIATTSIMLLIRQILLRESEIGKMLSSSGGSISSKPKSYIGTLRMVAKHKEVLILLILSAIQGISAKMIATFRPLFLTDSRALALDESMVSVIPAASSTSSILGLLLVIPRLKSRHIREALMLSYMCGFLGLVVLTTAPRESMFPAVVSVVFDSMRFLAVFSIMPVLMFNTVNEADPFAQAKIMSLMTAFSAMASWPVPAVGGYLYTIDPAFPFLVASASLIVGAGLLLKR